MIQTVGSTESKRINKGIYKTTFPGKLWDKKLGFVSLRGEKSVPAAFFPEDGDDLWDPRELGIFKLFILRKFVYIPQERQ